MEAAAGLGALGFWLFLTAIIVSGVWFDARKRESQQETLRRVVESGQPIDDAVIKQMLAATKGSSRPDRDLKIGGIILLFIAPGLTVLGWFLGKLSETLWDLMLGVSLLMVFIGVGLYVAGQVSERWQREDQPL